MENTKQSYEELGEIFSGKFYKYCICLNICSVPTWNLQSGHSRKIHCKCHTQIKATAVPMEMNSWP